MGAWGWAGGVRAVDPPGLPLHLSNRLLQSYLKGLERMEEEPEHMSREQGEGQAGSPFPRPVLSLQPLILASPSSPQCSSTLLPSTTTTRAASWTVWSCCPC